MRWDLFGSPSFEDHLKYNWDPASGDVLIPQESVSKVSPLYPQNITIKAGQVVPTPYMKNFLPRIGVAYRLTGKTVLRGGYGIFAIPYQWGPYDFAQVGSTNSSHGFSTASEKTQLCQLAVFGLTVAHAR